MSDILGYHVGEAIRVKVEISPHREIRKFSVDPEITSFEMLQSLLAKIYDMEGEFVISYMNREKFGLSKYITLSSDWDLDAAFFTSSQPYLSLKVEQLPQERGLDEWDIIAPIDVPSLSVSTELPKKNLADSFLIQMEKTFNFLQKALHISDSNEESRPLKNPMNNSEFHCYLDSDGRLERSKELRLSVYQGGIEPSLRSIVWKHILNVYSDGLTQSEQLAYLAKKNEHYERLKNSWQCLQKGHLPDKLAHLINNVWKDVLRTDRRHKYFSGANNEHLTSLFNILTTYAVSHPSVWYCQGMSDIVAPLLVIMKHEGHTYLCFCALMERLKTNFNHNGHYMMLKFSHLELLIRHYDPEFYQYLRNIDATELIFCYRWLLLELKREFAFDDTLHMLEVSWSSLPPSPPENEVPLNEISEEAIIESLISDGRSRHCSGYETGGENSNLESSWKERCCCHSQNYCECVQEGVRRRRYSLDPCFHSDLSSSGRFDDYFSTYPPTSKGSEGYISEADTSSEDYYCLDEKCAFVDSGMTDYTSHKDQYGLPYPQDLGGGHPFVLFLCLAILLQHRTVIMGRKMDYNDMAMHFDKLIRKHNLQRVLCQARNMFSSYLRLDWQDNEESAF